MTEEQDQAFRVAVAYSNNPGMRNGSGGFTDTGKELMANFQNLSLAQQSAAVTTSKDTGNLGGDPAGISEAQAINNAYMQSQAAAIEGTPSSGTSVGFDPISKIQSGIVTPVSAVRKAATGGSAADIAREIEASGGTVGASLAAKAIAQGYNPGYVQTIDRATVPMRDLSSGMGSVIFSSVPSSEQTGVGRNTVNAYVPYGNYAQTELENVKIGYSKPGEVGFYQQPYGHSTYNLVSSGGRNALQSGMFTINEPETPLVYTQESAGTKFAKIANIPEALKIIANPEYYSRGGAEVYGGYVKPLTGATVESSGAKLSTYYNQNNLANLVNPEDVNKNKSELPGANIPWSVPSSAPAIASFETIGLPRPFSSVGKSAEISNAPSEVTPANYLSTLQTPFTSVGKAEENPSNAGPLEIATTSLFKGELPTVGALWAATPIAKIINNWSWESAPIEETAKNIASTTSRGTEGLLNTAAILPFVSEAGVAKGAIESISPLAKGTIATGIGLGTSLLFGKVTEGPSQSVGEVPMLDLKAVPIINFAAIPASYLGANTKISANSEPGRFLSYGSGGLYKTADSVLGILPGNISIAPASLAITVPSKTPLQQFGVGAPTVTVSGGSADITALGNWLDVNKGKVETQEQADYYNKYVNQYNDMAAKNPTVTTTKNIVTVGSPDKTYKYGQFDIYSEKAGDVFRNLAGGYSPEQLNAYGETIKSKPGVQGLWENAVYGTGKFLSEKPLDVLPAIAAGTTLYLGGEAIGAGLGMAAKGSGAIGSVARTLTIPGEGGAIGSSARAVGKYGVPLYFGALMGWGVTEGLTATPQQTARNIGESAVPGVGMLWGAALPSILPSIRFGGASRGTVGTEPIINSRGSSPVDNGFPMTPREYSLTSKLGEGEIGLPQFNKFMGIKTGGEVTANTGMSARGGFLGGEAPKSDYLSGKMMETYGTTSPRFVENLVKQNAVLKAQERSIAGENYPRGGAVGKFLDTTPTGWFKQTKEILPPHVSTDFERYAILESMINGPTVPLLETTKAVSVRSPLFATRSTTSSFEVLPGGVRVKQTVPSGRESELTFKSGTLIPNSPEAWTTSPTSKLSIGRREAIRIEPYSGEVTVMGMRREVRTPTAGKVFGGGRSQFNLFNLPGKINIASKANIKVPPTSDILSVGFKKGTFETGAIRDVTRAGVGSVYHYETAFADVSPVRVGVAKQTREVGKAISDILSSKTPEAINVQEYSTIATPKGKVAPKVNIAPVFGMGSVGTTPTATVKPTAREPVVGGMRALEMEPQIGRMDIATARLQSMFGEFAPRSKPKAKSMEQKMVEARVAHAKTVTRNKQLEKQPTIIKSSLPNIGITLPRVQLQTPSPLKVGRIFAQPRSELNIPTAGTIRKEKSLVFNIPSAQEMTESRRRSNAMFESGRKEGAEQRTNVGSFAIPVIGMGTRSLTKEKQTVGVTRVLKREAVDETRLYDTLTGFGSDVLTIPKSGERIEQKKETARLPYVDIIAKPITEPTVTPKTKTTVEPAYEPKPEVKPKPPKLPVVGFPGMPAFGGGTSSVAPARRGKKYREIFEYNFNVGGATKATAKLLRKGSNIGTGSSRSIGSMGAPVKYKPAFNLPSAGLPKSLKLGSSAPKKKGEKK